jgi:hypothetical protein
MPTQSWIASSTMPTASISPARACAGPNQCKARSRERKQVCGHDALLGQRKRVAHMPTAATAKATSLNRRNIYSPATRVETVLTDCRRQCQKSDGQRGSHPGEIIPERRARSNRNARARSNRYTWATSSESAWIAVCLAAKRLHDADVPAGYAAFIILVPIIAAIIIGAIPGANAENRFGRELT